MKIETTKTRISEWNSRWWKQDEPHVIKNDRQWDASEVLRNKILSDYKFRFCLWIQQKQKEVTRK